MRKLAFSGLLIASGALWLALGQPKSPGNATPPANPLVKLNVVAEDSSGQLVTDLTAADFQVFDNGKLQHVASFHRNDAKALREPLAVAPGESSNRAGVPVRRATVILFDLLNAGFDDRGYANTQLVPALQHVEDSDSLFLYILSMDGVLYPVHPLPEGQTSARTGASPWTGDIKSLLDEAARKLFVLRPPAMLMDERIRKSYIALGTVASRLAEVSGRKSILWISHGMPLLLPAQQGFDQVDYGPLLQRFTALIDRDNVSVYTLRQYGASPGASDASLALSSTETLDKVAALTGGRSYDTVDIPAALARASSDMRMSYLIAFDPPLDKWDGKYHKIRVTCSRKGVRLLAKQGYSALAANAQPGNQEIAAFEIAAAGARDAAEIGVSGRMTATGKTPGEVNLEIRIDAADLQLAREGDAFTGQLAVGAAVYQADGKAEVPNPTTWNLRLSPADREQALKQGLALIRTVTLPPTVRKLRMMVYDHASGAVGSLTLTVPGAAVKP